MLNLDQNVLTLKWLQVDEYAPETEVHKYLHSRLAPFDVASLYELHYQMITLGKVSPPQCTADPIALLPGNFFLACLPCTHVCMPKPCS